MRMLAILFLLVGIQAQGQLKSFEIGVRGDTLNRVDKQGLRQGPWVVAVPDLRGERGYEEQGNFVNGKKEGDWTRFSLEGIKIADEQFRWGMPNGKQQYYTYFGGLSRVESWRAIDPANAFDTVMVYDLQDPDKVIGQVVVKNEGVAVKHGSWIYYNPQTGKVEEKVEYVMNRIKGVDETTPTGTTLMPLDLRGKPAYVPTTDSVGNKKIAKPAVIQDFEKKNSGKKSIRVRDGSTGNR